MLTVPKGAWPTCGITGALPGNIGNTCPMDVRIYATRGDWDDCYIVTQNSISPIISSPIPDFVRQGGLNGLLYCLGV